MNHEYESSGKEIAISTPTDDEYSLLNDEIHSIHVFQIELSHGMVSHSYENGERVLIMYYYYKFRTEPNRTERKKR